MAHFDFEKPIQDLEDQLKKVKEVADKGKIDVSASIKELEEKIVSQTQQISDIEALVNLHYRKEHGSFKVNSDLVETTRH